MNEQNQAITQQPKSVKDFLSLPAYKGRFEEILGKRAAQFMGSITNYVNQSRYIAECDPKSVIASAFIAATLDLPIDKNLGFAWIVPYKGKAQFQMGYRGYVQLAMRTAQYQAMNAKPINEEAFGGFDKQIGEPIILWDKVDETKPVAGYAVAWRMVNGFVKTAYWSKAKVQAHAERYSQAYRAQKKDSPWYSHFDQMALKTVLSNELRHWGILSIDFQKAYQHDQGTQVDIDATVVRDDGGLFETGTLEDALGDTQKKSEPEDKDKKPMDAPAEAAAQPEKKTEAPAKPAAQAELPAAGIPAGNLADVKRKLIDEISDVALDIDMNESQLLKAVPDAPKAARTLNDINVDQLQKLLAYAKDKKQLKIEGQ